ncbi:hypothetical protein PR003_g1461 [Phytophthora rubi]|uniref:Uncharacterized protein n=1 Tax=Phytophthora rubi TaxID=129364 RepID=A0A6A4G8D9_9STRA|nr:hypothetical protein PR003_g1461 [Phytophthora rubi]
MSTLLWASGSQFGVVYGQVGRSLVSSTGKWVAVWRRPQPSGSPFGVVYGQVCRSLVSSKGDAICRSELKSRNKGIRDCGYCFNLQFAK